MQPNSIAGASAPKLAPDVPQPNPEAASPPVDETPGRKVYFPGEDGGRSLNEMAQRDLEATLQLLAERAQYITGATGAAIALRDGADIVCRASAGSVAPEIGAHLQMESGLSGESIRTKQVLRCDDAHTDTRVNRESCEALGIASVVVMPLLRDQDVNGVFELLSDRPYAFEERDIGALERLGEMVQTALDHAAAAHAAAGPKPSAATAVSVEPQVESSLAEKISSETSEVPLDAEHAMSEVELDIVEVLGPVIAAEAASSPAGEVKEVDKPLETKTESPPAANSPAVEPDTPVPSPPDIPTELPRITGLSLVRQCSACGFPVSEGRVLCLDCEKKQKPALTVTNAQVLPANEDVAVPLFTMGAEGEIPASWFARNRVLMVVTAVVVVLVVALFLFR